MCRVWTIGMIDVPHPTYVHRNYTDCKNTFPMMWSRNMDKQPIHGTWWFAKTINFPFPYPTAPLPHSSYKRGTTTTHALEDGAAYLSISLDATTGDTRHTLPHPSRTY